MLNEDNLELLIHQIIRDHFEEEASGPPQLTGEEYICFAGFALRGQLDMFWRLYWSRN